MLPFSSLFVQISDLYKFLVSSVLKVLRVTPPPTPPFRAMVFRFSKSAKSVVIITVVGSMANKYRGKNACFAICLKVFYW